MATNTERHGLKKKKGFYKLVVIAFCLLVVSFILKVAPNYINNDITDKINLVINNSNVTQKLKADVLYQNGTIYLSQDDIKNFFDDNIYYDDQYSQIVTTSETKVAVLPVGNKQIVINGSNTTIYDSVIKQGDKYYLPFSEIGKSVYNAESSYIEKTNTVVISSLERALTYANSSKDNDVKYKPTDFSRVIEKIKRGENVTVVEQCNTNKDWTKITTANGKIGYVKSNTLQNSSKIRDDFTIEKQIKGKVSIAWDYFSEHSSAPSRTGKIQGVNVVSPAFITLQKQGQSNIIENIGQNGVSYINWAHKNGYKVWPLISNNSLKDSTSAVIEDYKNRQQFINNILYEVEKYNFDGINLDFENIYKKDKDDYTKLIIELAPRLKEMGKVLSVDVTAPDGSEDWSLCFDRNKIAKSADYIVFMGYDQNGVSSKEPGTTAGYDWVETNINKFLKQEQVDKDKLILGIPFYCRLWKINGSDVKSEVVSMKDLNQKLPSGTNKEWLEDLKQNFMQYTQNGITYKIWIEDEKSITEKLSLINSYDIAGAAFWEKDRENQDVWPIVSEKLNIE